MSETRTISLIGTGALGTTLAKAMHRHRYPIKSLYNRTHEKAERLVASLNVETSGTFPEKADELGGIVCIVVPDGSVSEVATELARLGDSEFWNTRCVLHFSGALTAAALDPLKNRGAAVGSLHPLQTFSGNSTPEDFEGIYFSYQGDDEAIEFIDEFIQYVGAQYIRLSGFGKPYIHAAAVMAANYFATLVEASGKIAEAGGVTYDDAVKLFFPLIRTMVDNVEGSNPKQALSGPLLRGDVETVNKHLKLMPQDEKELYQELGRYTLNHLTDLKRKNPELYKQMSKLFEKED